MLLVCLRSIESTETTALSMNYFFAILIGRFLVRSLNNFLVFTWPISVNWNFTILFQDLNTFLRAAAERSSLLLSNLDQEPSTTGNHESTPSRGDKYNSVSPLITDLEFSAISCSPLVATDLFDCESPCDRESLVYTPPDWTGGTHRSTSLSPLPQTPFMLSPLRSTRALSTISESPSLSTSSHLLSFNTNSETPRPEDLSTPEPSTCQNRLVFDTPPAHVTNEEHLNDGLYFLQTPGFGVSPPRTCHPLRPGETVSTESDNVPHTPVMPSPFRTPGKYSCFSLTLSQFVFLQFADSRYK